MALPCGCLITSAHCDVDEREPTVASGELAKSNHSLWLALLLSVRGHLFVLSGNLEQFLSHPLSSSFVRQRANAAGSLVALPRCQAGAYRFQDTPYCGQSHGEMWRARFAKGAMLNLSRGKDPLRPRAATIPPTAPLAPSSLAPRPDHLRARELGHNIPRSHASRHAAGSLRSVHRNDENDQEPQHEEHNPDR